MVGRSSAPSGQQPCCHEWWSRHAKAGSSLTPPRSSSFLSPCPGLGRRWWTGSRRTSATGQAISRARRSSSTSRSTPGGARPTACVRPAADWRASPLRWAPTRPSSGLQPEQGAAQERVGRHGLLCRGPRPRALWRLRRQRRRADRLGYTSPTARARETVRSMQLRVRPLIEAELERLAEPHAAHAA